MAASKKPLGSPSDSYEGISSILDTDLYKLTMHRAIRQHFPTVKVAYKFTNRTPHKKLNLEAYNWLKKQIAKFTEIRLTEDELQWLQRKCTFLNEDYCNYLYAFRFRPDEHIKLEFLPDKDKNDETGEITLSIKGLWIDTVLYEVPLLALISEAYFKFVDHDWSYDQQVENAQLKGHKLFEAGCKVSEFGTRRRRDRKTHSEVIKGLCEAQVHAADQNWSGKLTGTSNVYMAMTYNIAPIGTVAHEWPMGIAALTDDYGSANENALRLWAETYGKNILDIALTDTFGTPAFLRNFTRPVPDSLAKEPSDRKLTYSDYFRGLRQDSGDPLNFIKLVREWRDRENITDKKTIVFSDSLNVEKCIQFSQACEAASFTPSFGVGTFFTNDFTRASDSQKSVPLNIVIKLSEADGRPAIKLSDDLGKNMGDEALVARVKREVGYEDKSWTGGDEAHRWDK